MSLWANLPRVQAQQRILDGGFDPTDWEGIHELYMTAYDDEQLARDARLRSLKTLVRQETEAARLSRK